MQLGKLVGKHTPTHVTFLAQAKVKKLDYVTLRDPDGKPMLGIIDSLTREGEETLASVEVIGSRDKRGFLRAPRVPFADGAPVHSAEEQLIRETLGLPDSGLYVGTLDGYGIRVHLPPENLLQKHIAVLAKTGAGKSYATGVLLEELLENRIPAVVIDPHGEYHSLRFPNAKKDELKFAAAFGVAPKTYLDQIGIFGVTAGKPIRLPVPQDPEELWQILPAKLSSAHKGLLYGVMQDAKKYDFKGLIAAVSESPSNAKWNLVSLLEHLDRTGIFSGTPTKLTDLVRPGAASILDLRDATPEIQELLVSRLASSLFAARKAGSVPPFLFVVEEAHNFCPERGFGEVSSSRILRTIASEGRKFGMGLAIVSQRPARVDKSVLSQCNTQIIMKVTNPNDLKAIVESVEGVTPGLKEEIKDLPVGVALVVGATEQPLVVDIRIRRTAHGGVAARLKEERLPAQQEQEGGLLFFPQVSEQEIASAFPGAQKFELVAYPLWRVSGAERTVYVDAVLGELVAQDGSAVARSNGMNVLLGLPEAQRRIVLALVRSTYATVERLADELKLPVGAVRGAVRDLLNKEILSTEGFTVRNRVLFSLPRGTIAEVPVPGSPANRLEAAIPADTARAIAGLAGVKAAAAELVYYPYWAVVRDGKTVVVDGRTKQQDPRAAEAFQRSAGGRGAAS